MPFAYRVSEGQFDLLRLAPRFTVHARYIEHLAGGDELGVDRDRRGINKHLMTIPKDAWVGINFSRNIKNFGGGRPGLASIVGKDRREIAVPVVFRRHAKRCDQPAVRDPND